MKYKNESTKKSHSELRTTTTKNKIFEPCAWNRWQNITNCDFWIILEKHVDERKTIESSETLKKKILPYGIEYFTLQKVKHFVDNEHLFLDNIEDNFFPKKLSKVDMKIVTNSNRKYVVCCDIYTFIYYDIKVMGIFQEMLRVISLDSFDFLFSQKYKNRRFKVMLIMHFVASCTAFHVIILHIDFHYWNSSSISPLKSCCPLNRVYLSVNIIVIYTPIFHRNSERKSSTLSMKEFFLLHPFHLSLAASFHKGVFLVFSFTDIYRIHLGSWIMYSVLYQQ